MSNSPLVDFTKISPNKTSPRNHAIDTITIHCVVGQCSVESLGEVFAPTSRQASSNYGIGYDGKIGMYVEEADRSWCTSNRDNDMRAITIEVASDTKHPYAVNDKVYAALIKLVADICKRNNIKELKWKADKNLIGQVDKQNMTVHRWFANKDCPGEYLYSRHGDIADKVNKILNGSNVVPEVKPEPEVKPSGDVYRVQIAAYTQEKFAISSRDRMMEMGYDANIIKTKTSNLYKVQIGSFKTFAEAMVMLRELRELGFSAFVTVSEGTTLENNENPSKPVPFECYMVRVPINNLNIRKEPSTKSDVIRKCPRGIYTIIEEADGVGATKWGKLKSGEGWVSLDYVEKV